MHIQHIHKTLERLSEIACIEVSKNIECIDTCELGKVIDMIKDLSKSEYYSIIAKEMKKAEEEEEAEEKYILKTFKEEYGENEGKRYYDMWRYKSGMFAPKGKGTRRGYTEPPYYMTPEMYKKYDAEYYRDMDRSNGVMYYTPEITHSKSIIDDAKNKYIESRRTSSGTLDDNVKNAKKLDDVLKKITDEVTEIISADGKPISNEERTVFKKYKQTWNDALNI